jgi:hypothetical protein
MSWWQVIMHWFVGYRVVAGVAALILLGNRTVAAT